MTYVLYFIGIFAAIKLIHVFLVVKNLLNIRFKHGNCVLSDIDDIPGYLQELFDNYAGRLVDLGFTYSHTLLVDQIVYTEFSSKYLVCLYNSSNKCYANISISSLPDRINPVSVDFWTAFSDDTGLVTVNGVNHDIIGEVPGVDYFDPYAATIEDQYEAHINRLSENYQHKARKILSPSEHIEYEKKYDAIYFDHLINRCYLKKMKDGMYQMRLIPSIKHTIKCMAGMKKVQRMRSSAEKIAKAGDIPHVEVPVEAEVQAYQKVQQIQKPKKGRGITKLIVFLVSMLLFMGSFKVRFSLYIVFEIALIVLIHELGHYLGMFLFKYQDRSIVFIPFLGAATIGKDSKATILQKVVVYLMGPAPGMIIGTVILIGQYPEVVERFAVFMIIFNYLNLLPILPLDGGQVFHLAIFSRFRFLKILFMIFSIIILGLVGIYLDPIMLIIPAILAFSLFAQLKNGNYLAKLSKQIRGENVELKDEILLPYIFEKLKTGPFEKITFASKIAVVKSILVNIREKVPTLGQSLLAFMLYCIVFISPAFVALGTGFISGFSGIPFTMGSGVFYFYPAPNGQKVVVTSNTSFFRLDTYILDSQGRRIYEFEKETLSIDEDLLWVPGNDFRLLFYESGPQTSIFKKDRTSDKEKYYLFDIETGQTMEMPVPCIVGEEQYFEYNCWDSKGSWLMGSLNDSSVYKVLEIFKKDIDTGQVKKVDVRDYEISNYGQFKIIDDSRVIVDISKEYDLEKEYVIIDMDSGKSERFKLDNIEQLGFSNNGKSIYMLRKVFKDNMVRHEIAKIDLETGKEHIILDSSVMPDYSFEDAAKDKDIYISFALSPGEKWITYEIVEPEENGVCYIFSPGGPSPFSLYEYDKNTYTEYTLYSKDEMKYCTVNSWHNDDYSDSYQVIDIYDLSDSEPVKSESIKLDDLCYQPQFFGNDGKVLYVMVERDESKEDFVRELYIMDTATGSTELFEKSNHDE